MNTQETAIQIELGTGKVGIIHFTDKDGVGLIFKDSGVIHPIGTLISGELRTHPPEPGEIYLKCTSVESMEVLYQMILEMRERMYAQELYVRN